MGEGGGELTDDLESQGEIGVLIGGPESEYGRVHLGVHGYEDHAHVGGYVEAGTRAPTEAEDKAQTDPRLEPFFRYLHSSNRLKTIFFT